MIANWLYSVSLEATLLIVVVLILRPIVRRTLGAQIAYLLWLVPVVRALLPSGLESSTVLEAAAVPFAALPAVFDAAMKPLSLSPSIPWEALWIAGLGAWLALRLTTWFRFRQTLHTRATPVTLPTKLLVGVSQKVKLPRQEYRIFSGPFPSAPFVTGLLRPAVFLPADFFERFSEQEQQWVMAHELSHIRRRDLWVQFAGESLRALFWFNPAVHFAVHALQEDQELACDQSVLSHCSKRQRYDYGRALLAGAGAHLAPSTMTFFNKNKERYMLLRKHKVSKLNNSLGIALCAALSVVALTAAPISIAQSGLLPEEKISLNFEQIPLATLVETIAEFAGVEMSYPKALDEMAVSVQVKNVPAAQAFSLILSCAGYNHTEDSKRIEVVKAELRDAEKGCERSNGSIAVSAGTVI